MTTKKHEAEDEPETQAGGPAWVKSGRYIGAPSGRRFEAPSNTGSFVVCVTGDVYKFTDEFAYLWTDPQYSHLFEWLADPGPHDKHK